MNTNRSAMIRMIIILAAIIIISSSLIRILGGNSQTLEEYAEENLIDVSGGDKTLEELKASEDTISYDAATPTVTKEHSDNVSHTGNSGQASSSTSDEISTDSSGEQDTMVSQAPSLIGVTLNGEKMEEERILYKEGFYYEPLSSDLRRYITGVTYPQDAEAAEITPDELRYVHILYIDFEGNSVEGEMICNELIAQDLMEIFHELYQNEYRIEKIRLMDEYDGDDLAATEDNNTSCFNYRTVEGTETLSKHALGLAVDINPLYNPYITYGKNGEENISPASAEPYADRTIFFPYKIDETDLCYKLFKQHGFIWGGNWNSCKDYQHFQKAK